MKFCEIVNDLIGGKSLSRTSWSSGIYIKMRPQRTVTDVDEIKTLTHMQNVDIISGEITLGQLLIKYDTERNNAYEYTINSSDLCADDWFVVDASGDVYELFVENCTLVDVISNAYDESSPGRYAFRHVSWKPETMVLRIYTTIDGDIKPQGVHIDGSEKTGGFNVDMTHVDGYQLYTRVDDYDM